MKPFINTSAWGASSFCVHVRSLIEQVKDQALKDKAHFVHMHVDASQWCFIKTCTSYLLVCYARWLPEYVLALGALAALQVTETIHVMHYLKRCACHSRASCGQMMALKIASLGSKKHHSLKHQTSYLMALRSLWGECVPHVLLAGALTGHGHGYGVGTTLLPGRHPAPATNLLLTVSKCALYKVALTLCCKTSLPGEPILT